MTEDKPQMNSQQVLQMLQQKIGNLELTVHALMNVLEKEDLLDQDRINEEAQEIIKEMQSITDEEIQEEVDKRVKETSDEE